MVMVWRFLRTGRAAGLSLSVRGIAMRALLPKDIRTIWRAVRAIFKAESLAPRDTWRSIPPREIITRTIHLQDHRVINFSETGIAHLRSIVTKLDNADYSEGLVHFSDLWSACHKVVEACWADKVVPSDVSEFLEGVEKNLMEEID